MATFETQKLLGLLSIFFAQTRLIWNILSTGTKNWHMGYNSHSIFITKHKFAIKIEKKSTNIEFRNHLGVKFLEMKWILEIFVCLDFSILIVNLCPVVKSDLEIYSIYQILEPALINGILMCKILSAAPAAIPIRFSPNDRPFQSGICMRLTNQLKQQQGSLPVQDYLIRQGQK